MHKLCVLAGAAALAFAVSAGAASAQLSPAAYGTQFDNPNGVTGPGAPSGSAGDGQTGPYVGVIGTTPGTDASATAFWQVELISSAADVPVPIVVNGAYQANASGSGIVNGAFDTGPSAAPDDDVRWLSFSCQEGEDYMGGCGQYQFSYRFNLATDIPYTFDIVTGGGFVGGGPGTFEDRLDPLISIDPSYDGPPVTLLVSPGALPPSGAPEPAAWAVLLAGFGGLGGMLRLRRQGVVVGRPPL